MSKKEEGERKGKYSEREGCRKSRRERKRQSDGARDKMDREEKMQEE